MGAKSGTRNRPQRLHVLGQTDQKLRDSIRRSSPFFISVPSLFGYILSILPPMGLQRFQKPEECSIHDPVPSVDKNHIQFGVWVINLIFPHKTLRNVGAYSTSYFPEKRAASSETTDRAAWLGMLYTTRGWVTRLRHLSGQNRWAFLASSGSTFLRCTHRLTSLCFCRCTNTFSAETSMPNLADISLYCLPATRMSRIVLFSFSANEKTSSRLVAARRGKKGRL